MKPLVYYCRWQGVVLRLRGRNETAVWGQLVYSEEDGERSQEFRFDLKTSTLTLQPNGGPTIIKLDDMGVPLDD